MITSEIGRPLAARKATRGGVYEDQCTPAAFPSTLRIVRDGRIAPHQHVHRHTDGVHARARPLAASWSAAAASIPASLAEVRLTNSPSSRQSPRGSFPSRLDTFRRARSRLVRCGLSATGAGSPPSWRSRRRSGRARGAEEGRRSVDRATTAGCPTCRSGPTDHPAMPTRPSPTAARRPTARRPPMSRAPSIPRSLAPGPGSLAERSPRTPPTWRPSSIAKETSPCSARAARGSMTARGRCRRRRAGRRTSSSRRPMARRSSGRSSPPESS